MNKSDLINVKEFNSREDLLKFLNEFAQTHNLIQNIISIVKDTFGRYEVFYYKD